MDNAHVFFMMLGAAIGIASTCFAFGECSIWMFVGVTVVGGLIGAAVEYGAARERHDD